VGELDPEVAVRLRRVISILSRRFGAAARAVGLSPTQVSLLGAVARRGPTRVSDLAEFEGVNPTMVSRVIGKLAEAGLVRRQTHGQDARVVLVEATAAGVAIHEQVRRERTQALAANLDRLPDALRADLLAALPALELLATGWTSTDTADAEAPRSAAETGARSPRQP
jgi:DNA-binding MarR family transcriptional regulator